MIRAAELPPAPATADMELTLDLQIASDSPRIPAEAALAHWAAAALAGRRDAAEVTIRVVDEPEGADLNARYRGRSGATNVLSFPFEAPPGIPAIDLLGDLVVCAPVVEREAAEQARALDAHWAHMVVHGLLHLLGFDHQDDAEARQMEALETVILGGLGFPQPYEDP